MSLMIYGLSCSFATLKIMRLCFFIKYKVVSKAPKTKLQNFRKYETNSL